MEVPRHYLTTIRPAEMNWPSLVNKSNLQGDKWCAWHGVSGKVKTISGRSLAALQMQSYKHKQYMLTPALTEATQSSL